MSQLLPDAEEFGGFLFESDELGVLVMGHDFKSWWTGSQLDIHETRKLAPNQNATTLQVACSVLGAVAWMIENPKQGVNVPDDLPHEFVLKWAKPYLGPYVSKASDWDPTQNRFDIDLFKKYNLDAEKKIAVWLPAAPSNHLLSYKKLYRQIVPSCLFYSEKQVNSLPADIPALQISVWPWLPLPDQCFPGPVAMN